MDILWQDLRHAVRRLRRDFGFTAGVVLTLAIGVSANTAVFGVVRSILLEPLPYVEPDRLGMWWIRAFTSRRLLTRIFRTGERRTAFSRTSPHSILRRSR